MIVERVGLRSDGEEVMEKEEGEKGGLLENELPFIPFASGSPASCLMMSWQSHRPGPSLSRSYLIFQPTPPPAGQCDATPYGPAQRARD
jgi:hypothetical protein